jgi:hypothetical protein
MGAEGGGVEELAHYNRLTHPPQTELSSLIQVGTIGYLKQAVAGLPCIN